MTAISQNQKQYADEKFLNLQLTEDSFEELIFDTCHFKACDFSESNFKHCKFIDCEFSNCNLSLIKIKYCTFSNTIFDQSKMLGINWTEITWPQIQLASPITFYQCDLTHSSFFELSLDEIVFEGCKVQDVDFRGANLPHSNFTNTDLLGSLFMHTQLNHADFTDAINYNLDPSLNNIKKAKFSLPEAVSLLNHLDIEII
jgi:fluoroquinolone resistance protein